MATTQKKSKIHVTDFLSLLATILLPCLYLYFKNVELVLFKDATTTSLFFILNGLVFFGIAYLFLKDVAKACLTTSLAILFVLTFDVIEKVFHKTLPFFYYWHIILVLLTLVFVFGMLLKRHLSTDAVTKINTVILIMFGGLILYNGVLAAPTIIKNANKEKYIKADTNLQESGKEQTTNVYLFIFDEYSGLDALNRYTSFDNSAFYDSLTSLGFTVSPHSRNETISTNLEIPNLLNLKRILTEKNFTNNAKSEALAYPTMVKLFKENGYKINLINDQGFLPTDMQGIDYAYSPQNTFTKAETFQTMVLKKTAYYPLLQVVEGNRLNEINDLFVHAEKLIAKSNSQQFTIGYFMAPHLPWVADENGNPISDSERSNGKDPSVYLGQLKYISKKIIALSEKIIAQDSDSVIILLADHGLRYPAQLQNWYGEEIENMDEENYYQTNILNAVYFKGDLIETDGLSGVNTLITTVNKLFEMDLPLVEKAE